MMIGIDLGTTNSLVSVFRNGRPEIIPNRLGKHLTPSVVSVDASGTVYVGETAKERGMLYPLETASVFKRSMGTDREYNLSGKSYRAEELSSLVLRSLKEDAEVYLGEEVKEAIISVPAYFNDLQRKATKHAGELAGLEVKSIINEPTAAAISCGITEDGSETRYLVFDLGGGTFDVSILELFDSVMEVHAIAGDNFIGGEDFTALLATMYLEEAAIAPESMDLKAMSEIMKAAEIAKCQFAAQDKVTICCQAAENHSMTIDRKTFEEACAPLLEKLRKPIERSIKDAGISLADIDKIVMVGGATRLPMIRRFVARVFERIPVMPVDPDESVALGAAIQCGMKERDKAIRETILTDVCPFTLGTEVSVDNGLFEESGHYLPIIERNTVIPVSRTQTVCTAHDNQKRVDIKILQGESRLSYNNLLLGELSVPVPPGPKGKEAVEITYTYDVNALLEVEVNVLSTGVKRRVIVQNESSHISDEEAAERLEKLQYLKQNPRNDEANRLQILRGERLYEENAGDARVIIDRALTEFDIALAGQDRTKIELARKKLEGILDNIEFGK